MENSKQYAFPIKDEASGLTKRELMAKDLLVAYTISGVVHIETIWSKIRRLLGINGWHVRHENNLELNCKCAIEAADELLKQLENK